MGQSKLILTCKRERWELIGLDLVEASSQGLERACIFCTRAKASRRGGGHESAGLS